MYAKYASVAAKGSGGKKLKPFHHIRLDAEFKLNCRIWRTFLTHFMNLALCCPMVDLNKFTTSKQLCFMSDASANPIFGIGAVFNHRWLFGQWEAGYIKTFEPSIEYLELLGVVAAILTGVTCCRARG